MNWDRHFYEGQGHSSSRQGQASQRAHPSSPECDVVSGQYEDVPGPAVQSDS